MKRRSNLTSWLLDVGGYLGDCALTALLRDSVTTGAVTFDVHGLEANARTIRAYHARDNYLPPARGSAANVSVHPTARGGRCVQADFGGGGGGSRSGITLPDACSSTRVRMSTPAAGAAAEATDKTRALATRTAENGLSPPPRHYLSTARILPHAPRRVFGFVEGFVSDKQEVYINGQQPATITLDSVLFPAPASTTKEGIGLRVKVTGAAAAKVLRGAVQLLQAAPPFLILQDLLDDKDAREVLSLLAENVSLEKYWILSADLQFLNAEKIMVQNNLGGTSSSGFGSARKDRDALLEKTALPERSSSSSGSCESFDCLSEDASAPTACWLRGLTLIRQQAKRETDYKNPVAWATLFLYGTHDEPVRRFGAVSSYAVVPARAGCKTLQIALPRAEKMGHLQVNFTVATGLD
eukprot:g4545.t1